MRCWSICLFVLCLSQWAGFAVAQGPETKEAAIAAAQEWLSLIDSGEYAQSWRDAAGYFRNAVPEKRWVQSLNAARKPLGRLVSRTVTNTMYRTSLPGAPDDKYVVIRFKTSFANKKSAIETVTAMLEKDGTWRVAGYYIK